MSRLEQSDTKLAASASPGALSAEALQARVVVVQRATTSDANLPSFNVVKRNPKTGHETIVSGVKPQAGESIPHLIERLYPNLSKDQVAYETRQALKYNRENGNDLGDGSRLKQNQTVYLTSVEYKDENGKVAKIVSPTGRITEIAYDNTGVAAYRIHKSDDPDGKYVQTVIKGSDGKWVEQKADGSGKTFTNVVLDDSGDLITTDSGEQVAHLSCGDDMYTEYSKDGKPVSGYAERDGGKISIYAYDYDHNKATVTYADTNTTVALDLPTPDTSNGDATSDDASAGDRMPVDISPDSYAGNVISAARSLLGHSGPEFGVDGSVACVKFVTLCLTRAGIPFPKDDQSTDRWLPSLTAYLPSQGFKNHPFSETQPQPGDLIASDGHIVIYEGNGKILANSSHDQKFEEQDLSYVFPDTTDLTIWRPSGASSTSSSRTG